LRGAIIAAVHTVRLVVGCSTGTDYNAIFRVYDCQFLTPHFTRMLAAYWGEYINIVGLRPTIRLGRGTRGAAPFGEWEVTFENTPRARAVLMSFPVLR
jgi:hypothetical protein